MNEKAAENDAGLHEVIEQCVEDHHRADDWKCSCGEDLFGGTAAYSWALFKSHFAANAAAVVTRAILRGVDEGWICDLCGCWNRYAGRCKFYDEAHEHYEAQL